MEANDSDFCDRLPGQHTGRLSLELQWRELSEWNLRIEKLEMQIRNLQIALSAMTSPISPEVPQAHGLTTPATPSAAVGADGPGADPFFEHKRIEFLEDRITQQGRQIAELIDQLDVKDDAISKLSVENARLTKLNHHLREVAVMAIIERVPDDSKPKNVHSHESEDTPRGNDVPVSDTVPPEIGKRYVCRNGEVTEAMGAGLRTQTYPFRACVNGVTRTWMRDGKHDESKSSDYDLIAEYREPSPPSESPSTVDSLRKFAEQLESGEPIKATRIERHDTPDGPMHVRTETELKPAESPDVVGEIRGLQYALEWIAAKRAGNPKLKAAAWEMLNDMQTAYEAAVARLQDGESINSTSQTDVPAESPDDWVVLRDPNHVIRECDWLNHRANDRWNKFSITAGYKIHNYPDYNFRCRRKDLPPVPVVPKTRTVTLREYRHTEGTAWSSSNWLIESRLTGRTCECEVPE